MKVRLKKIPVISLSHLDRSVELGKHSENVYRPYSVPIILSRIVDQEVCLMSLLNRPEYCVERFLQ